MKRFLTFILIFLVACNHKNNIEAISLNDTSKSFKELKKGIIENGNIEYYDTLFIAYLDEQYPEEFLYYALIMANKYNYPQAYYDVSDCLILTYNNHLEEIDEYTANLAIYYLLKASEMGHHQAVEEVKKYKIIYNEKINKEQIINIYRK